jgi:hypothetical protein
MQPRLVFRTHYQVDEPAYMEFLIKLCTSGVKSIYTEIAARKLSQEIRARCKDFNEAAGHYAVDLARSLGLVTANNVWTDKGLLVDLIAKVDDGESEDQLSLTLSEKLLHFRIFLEADGAAFLYLARYLLEYGSIPRPNHDVNLLIQETFIDILSGYLTETSNTADRVTLRNEIEKLRKKGYQGNTGSHKFFIHIHTLYRMGLVAKSNATSRVYHLPEQYVSMRQGLEALLNNVPHILALEKAVTAHRLVEIAAEALLIPYTLWNVTQCKEALRIMAQFYQRIIFTGIPLCPLSTLLESTQIELLTSGILLGYTEALSLLTEVQQKYSKQVRFHVDRRGQPAFVKISNDMVDELAAERIKI